jgi:hypothetical protein
LAVGVSGARACSGVLVCFLNVTVTERRASRVPTEIAVLLWHLDTERPFKDFPTKKSSATECRAATSTQPLLERKNWQGCLASSVVQNKSRIKNLRKKLPSPLAWEGAIFCMYPSSRDAFTKLA